MFGQPYLSIERAKEIMADQIAGVLPTTPKDCRITNPPIRANFQPGPEARRRLAAAQPSQAQIDTRQRLDCSPAIVTIPAGQDSAFEGLILGVLALLLGFTMSMAVTRFEVRKHLVLEEANAIGTSYLRTQLLPAPEGTEIANLLREYVVVRLQYADAGGDLDRLQATREQAARLQNEFWTRAVAYVQKDPSPVKAGLLLQSLNEVIDLESARWMAFQNHVPRAVIYVNYIVALFAVILVGYAFGREGRRQVFSTSMLILAITVVLAVIVDLDQPRQGFIKVSQQPLVDQRAVPDGSRLPSGWRSTSVLRACETAPSAPRSNFSTSPSATSDPACATRTTSSRATTSESGVTSLSPRGLRTSSSTRTRLAASSSGRRSRS
jgi:hypothetical protein